METEVCDLTDIVLLLKERIYTNNPYTRQFIVSWVSHMVYWLSSKAIFFLTY